MSKKRVSGAWVDDTPHIYNTSTDTFSTLPHEVIGDGTAISAYTIKGNMSQSGTPTPSNPVYPTEVGEKTANLFDKNNTIIQNAFINENNYWALSSDSRSIRIPVQPNTTYTLSVGVSLSVFVICETSQSNPQPESTQTTSLSPIYKASSSVSQYTFTTSADTKFIVFQGNRAFVDEWFNSLMLNTGSTAKPYEPYGYKIPILSNGNTYPVYLAEPIRKISTYVDTVPSTGTASRVIKKLVLTGEENVRSVSAITGGVRITVEKVLGALNDSIHTRICSHFKSSTNWIEIGAFEFLSTLTGIYMQVPDSMGIETTQDVQQWLADQYAAGAPVTFWYVLATPTTETFTAPTIPTSGTAQTFDIDTTLKPSEVILTYHGWHEHTDTKYTSG